MAVKKDKTTIIFVNKNQSSYKPLQVSSSYILHWKKYVAALIGCFILLLMVIFYLSYSKESIQLSKDTLTKELRKREGILSPADTVAIKKYYLSIDRKLLKINKYLNARGIKPIAKNEGGEQGSDLLSVEETEEFYGRYLDRMISYVAFTPLGYPHSGVITSEYGHRENPFNGENIETHKGLDIRGHYGELVRSTASGRVAFAGFKGKYGNCIVIDHGNGFETYYGHLSRILVKEGQPVNAGDEIGRIGSTGRSTGPHLHYEIHRNNKIINPRSFLTIE